MHKQEFERSVQQKMEELSFAPSAPVWEKVAQKIQQKKKRRRFLVWLVPAAMLGIAVGYALIGNDIILEKKKQFTEKKATRKTPNNQHTVLNTKRENNTKKAFENKIRITGTKGQKAYHHLASIASQKKVLFKAAPQNGSKHQELSLPEKYIDITPTIVTDVPHQDPTHSVNILTKTGALALLPVPVLRSLQQLHNTQPVSPIAAPPLVENKPGARWQWMADVQYGRANIVTHGLFASEGTGRLNDPATSWGNPVLPTLQAKPGPFITAAIGIQRNSNKGFSIATGLRYAAYTQRLRVGEKINRSNFALNGASADAFNSTALYKPDTLNAYFQSRYQQLSVPLVLGKQLLKKWLVEGEAGLAIGYLRAGKSLRYDTAARIFYAYKPNIQPLQVQAHAALKYPFVKKGNWQWLAITQIDYHLTTLYADNRGKKRIYAWSAGLQLRKK